MAVTIAAIYARVSSELSDVENSISAQLAECRAYCAKQGWQVPDEFTFVEPDAISAKDDNRPAFARMIGMAKTSPAPFGVIVVLNRTRFMRNYEKSVVYRGMLRKHGVRLASVKEPVDDNPTGRLIEAILDSVAEYQREYVAIETVRGQMQNAREGYSIGGLAYGYRRKIAKTIQRGHLESHKVVWEPEPEQAPIVRRIFARYVAGDGYKAIAVALNADGVPSPTGAEWMHTSIKSIIENEAYLGRRIANRHMERRSGQRWKERPRDEWVITEGAHEALVDVATFERAQAMRTARRGPERAQTTRNEYLLSGLVVCVRCGYGVWGQGVVQRNKDGTKRHYRQYRCRGSHAGVCASKTVSAARIEERVIEAIGRELATVEGFARIAAAPAEVADVERPDDEVRAELAEMNRKIGRLVRFLEAEDDPDPDVGRRLRELRRRQAELQDQVTRTLQTAKASLAMPIDLADLQDLADALPALEVVERKALLGMLIDRAELDLVERWCRLTLRGGAKTTIPLT